MRWFRPDVFDLIQATIVVACLIYLAIVLTHSAMTELPTVIMSWLTKG